MREREITNTQPGRPREFDAGDVLSTIMRLFWEHGFDATGLSDITKATGLRKASLYAAFGNKQSMYLKALAHYETMLVDPPVHALRDQSRPALDRVSAFLRAPIAAVEKIGDRRGCFLCNASADRGSLDRETGDLVRRGYEKMRRALEETIGEQGNTKDPAVTRRNAQLVLTVYSGLRVMARSGTEVSKLKAAKQACLQALRHGG